MPIRAGEESDVPGPRHATADELDQLTRSYEARPYPVLLDVPRLQYLAVDGHGGPTGNAYQAAVTSLFAVAHRIKLLARREHLHLSVPPLESLWWSEDPDADIVEDRSGWRWRVLLAQPDSVTPELVAEASAGTVRRSSAAGGDVHLVTLDEGLSAQVLHVGPHDAATGTLRRLRGFITDEGLEPSGPLHEIHLSDPRHTDPSRLRTLHRQPVRPVQRS